MNMERVTHPGVLAASYVIGDKVKNLDGESIGRCEDLMIDPEKGRIAYVILSFEENRDRYFAVPWGTVSLNLPERELIFRVNKDRLRNAPGFHRDEWPDITDREWGRHIHTYYGRKPYWES